MKREVKILVSLAVVTVAFYFFMSYAMDVKKQEQTEERERVLATSNYQFSTSVPEDKGAENLEIDWVFVRVGGDIILKDGEKFDQGIYWEISHYSLPKEFPSEEEIKKEMIQALNGRVSPSINDAEVEEIVFSYTNVAFLSCSNFQLRKGAEMVVTGDDFSMPVKSYEEKSQLSDDSPSCRGTKISIQMSSYTEPLIRKIVGILRAKGHIFRLLVFRASPAAVK